VNRAGACGPTTGRQLDRDALLRRGLLLSILSILINAVVGGTGVIAALTSGSLSLLGFGFDAAIDSAASVALVWRFMIEGREPHRAERVEKTAEGVVGAVLIILGAYLAFSAIRALAAQEHPAPTLLGTAILIASIAILPPLALAKYRTAQRLESGALRADSILTAIAVLLAAIGLVSLGLSEVLGLTWADSAGALVVAAIVLREGWASVRAMRNPLEIGV
jgi:divalent metal cation (Fe/Co/Zn/Cd) transporter